MGFLAVRISIAVTSFATLRAVLRCSVCHGALRLPCHETTAFLPRRRWCLSPCCCNNILFYRRYGRTRFLASLSTFCCRFFSSWIIVATTMNSFAWGGGQAYFWCLRFAYYVLYRREQVGDGSNICKRTYIPCRTFIGGCSSWPALSYAGAICRVLCVRHWNHFYLLPSKGMLLV